MSKLIGVVAWWLLGLTAQAGEPTLAPLLATCAACHGAQGEGNPGLAAPRLAGQNAQYLARQLGNFKTASRGYAAEDLAGQRMAAIAQSLSAEQISHLAAHYAALPIVTESCADTPANPQGGARYQDTCAACHGQFAQGYPALQAPNLSLLDGWYIEQQLNAFALGWRGAGESADIQSQWMRSIASQVSDSAERQALVAFIEANRCRAARAEPRKSE